jgi:hypothetical protein
MIESMRILLAAAAAAALASACGDSADADFVAVRFEYRAPTVTDGAIAFAYPACIQLVGRTHIHPSWQDFRLVFMTAEEPDLWTVSFQTVRPGRHSIRVSDPNACVENDTGAVTAHAVYANGTLLTRMVDTPGTGIEPGFSLAVSLDGSVQP